VKIKLKFSVQTDESNGLKEALESYCDEVRFGPEFCEWKIPDLSTLRKAYSLTVDKGKVFAYVTPRVSTGGMKKIREQIDFLSGKGKMYVVINDFGVLNILSDYPELKPHLGRQLIYIPGRSPWLRFNANDIVRHFPSSLTMKMRMGPIEDLYSRTSLNYAPTADFFERYGIKDVDVDWIPKCFPYYGLLVKKGFSLSVHLHLVLVTITRRCHTARFLGEERAETCSKLCHKRAFLLKTPVRSELYLNGNTVFSFEQFSRKDLTKLLNSDITKFVVTMNPITRVSSHQEIDNLISQTRKMLKIDET